MTDHPPDRSRDIEEINRKLLAYPEAVDRGDFVAVGRLFDGMRLGDSEPMSAAQFEAEWRRCVRVFEDGSPCTKHLVTNIDIEFDESGRQARVRSYYTVLQARPELDPRAQVILTGTYHDEFEAEADGWRWVRRAEQADLIGNLEFHLTPEAMELVQPHAR